MICPQTKAECDDIDDSRAALMAAIRKIGEKKMPDITMCDSDACPQSAKCYRYMAVPSQYRQSYAYFYRGPELKCDYFSAIRPGDIIRRHSADQESNPSPEASPQAVKGD